MKRFARAVSYAFVLMGTACCALPQLGCVRRSRSTAASSALTSLCVSNMMDIWWLLRTWQGEGIAYPPDLSFVANQTNLSLFLCPSTGRQPGEPSAVSSWTDFIYVRQSQSEPRMPLLLSAPEDHDGLFGLVVWEAGYWERVSPTQFSSLVRTPWCMEYSSTNQALRVLKAEITVHVPKRLRAIYPDAYQPLRDPERPH